MTMVYVNNVRGLRKWCAWFT